MKLYRSLVSFAIALFFVFVAWYAYSLFAVLESGFASDLVRPSFAPSPALIEWAWIAVYVFYIVMITVSIQRKPLRKSLTLLGLLLSLNVAWAASFFLWHLTLLSLSVTFLQVVVLFLLIKFYAKNTKELWLAALPAMAWHIYCFIVSYGIVMLN